MSGPRLTLGKATSNRVSEVVLPPRTGRNEACHCGSGIKYKRCCREQDEALRRQLRGAVWPEWIDGSRSKLYQFEKYVCNVFGLPDLLASLVDTRRAPKIPTFDVVNSLFHTAVLRIPSINALEGDLKDSDFQKLIGRQPPPDVKAFSADVVANVLDKLQLDGMHQAIDEVIGKAERNKAFRDGCYSALRCVAIDGWEPFSSFDRHCPNCLVRKVKVRRRTGELEEVDQYYHSYVVAMLLGSVIDVVLGIEPVLNEEARRDIDSEVKPGEAVVVTVGYIHAGTKNNIIPDHAELGLTVRTYDPEVRKQVLAAIARIVKGEAEVAGVQRLPTVERYESTDAMYDDPWLARRLTPVLETALGKANVEPIEPVMASEDYSYFIEAGIPSFFYSLGGADPQKFADSEASGIPLPSNHSPFFAPDASPALRTAIASEVAVLRNLLSGSAAALRRSLAKEPSAPRS